MEPTHNRLKEQVDIWETKNRTSNEHIVLGDFNLDAQANNKTNGDNTRHQRKQIKMFKVIKEKLTDKGAILLNHKITRTAGQDKDSQLDHAYTNRPDKIIAIHQDSDTTSDHHAIIIDRKMKITYDNELYVTARNFKKIYIYQLAAEVITDERYEDLKTNENPDYVAQTLVNVLNQKLDNQEPIKTHKIKLQVGNKLKLTEHTRQQIADNNEHIKYPRIMTLLKIKEC